LLPFIQLIVLIILAYAATALSLPYLIKLLSTPPLIRKNYLGKEIPTAAGLILLILLPFFLVLALIMEVKALNGRLSLLFALTAYGFGLIGFIDDVLGSITDKGFHGHIQALIKEKRLSSGMLKLIMGFVFALLMSLLIASFYPAAYGAWYQIILNTFLIALSANLINLFDLRPGRAGKIYFIFLAICIAFAWHIDSYGGPIILMTALYLPVFLLDLHSELMLGDTGANLLGATLGFACVIWFTWPMKLFFMLVFLGLQIISEYISFSSIIERVGFLHEIDLWGRKNRE
jgi:UDP-GlcNAc:undecaprenyl-phosphate/decaprenyl-phosphate GlcNAc-1-phosphate transferase